MGAGAFSAQGYGGAAITIQPRSWAILRNSRTSALRSVPGNALSRSRMIAETEVAPSIRFRIWAALSDSFTIPSGYSKTWAFCTGSHCRRNRDGITGICSRVSFRRSAMIVIIAQTSAVSCKFPAQRYDPSDASAANTLNNRACRLLDSIHPRG